MIGLGSAVLCEAGWISRKSPLHDAQLVAT
jgi:hypothetical protein